MGDFVQQIITILSTFPGNLVYLLILAFSIAGSFQAALNLWRKNGFPQGRRMVFGLGLLLVTHLILFIGIGLADKSLAAPQSMLPVMERSSMALSLILIIWLWAFPEQNRTADIAIGSLAFFTVIATVFGTIWWEASSALNFNQTQLDLGWGIFSIVLILFGIVILIYRKPNSWGIGLAMLLILMVGYLSHLVYPISDSNVPGSVRLAQMVAFPLLLALPHRFQIPTTTEPLQKRPEPIIQERVQYSINPQVFDSILSIGTQNTITETCQTITEVIGKTMLADICLAVLPANKDGKISIQSGYDLIRQKNLASTVIEAQDIPMIHSAMERTLPLRLPASSTSRDLSSLGSKFNVGRTGHLLASFVKIKDQSPLLGIILLSPYSNRGWSNDDQSYLSNITDGLAQILQRTIHWKTLQNDVTKSREELKAFQILIKELRNENAGLRSALSEQNRQTLQENEAETTINLESTQQPYAKIKRLEAENLRLEALVQKLLTESETQLKSPSIRQLEEELNQALDEINVFKSRLAAADQELHNLPFETNVPTASTRLSDQQIEVFTSITQDLRQPMSSIVGYTDLLLGETIGILGELQRKFLERVKASAERMQIMLDELMQIVFIEGDQLVLKPEKINLGNIIDEAIMATSSQLRDRNISLRVDLPEKLPKFQADRDAMIQIFFHLLKNAGSASPIEGEIFLRASTYKEAEDQEYMLIQIADQGGGIPIENLPRVFSRSYRADNPIIEGVGDSGVGLSIAKTLVEAHQGRIWVDTESGQGSTFSVLIPLLNGNSGDSDI
ncbi:MAG: ATP-binding protein [Anaerolineales bacterium]|jgi:signal transduction histidine kinase